MFDLKMKYCCVEVMSEHLRKAGSLLTIHGVYGLSHGCVAAPCLVMPSEYLMRSEQSNVHGCVFEISWADQYVKNVYTAGCGVN